MFQEGEDVGEEEKLCGLMKKRSESRHVHGVRCQYHQMLCLHDHRMIEMKKNMTFIEFDDFVKIYSGDYLYIDDVRKCFDVYEVIFTIYNSKDHNFYKIRTFLTRQRNNLMDLKNHLVRVCSETKSIKKMSKHCNCVIF